ncbi:hypothetical protein N4G70_28160 [Streptomyces sp. ASQP_92]|uniref:hypothetical protein n=1 Tax=Streptomyces sp. ASQP_92 TaxID=2979116 RepID=UPI0021C178A0|nr:hypothetical protein [Streptomyces sp. ASQP_92]MCT9092713.1 hypothetical protein [Streptomyces sp. ASQP_92]
MLGGTAVDRWIGGPMGLAGTGLSARPGAGGAGVARCTGGAGCVGELSVAELGRGPSPRTGMGAGAAGVWGVAR